MDADVFRDRNYYFMQYIDRIEASRLDMPYDLLLDAISEGGGITNINGPYPVTNVIIGRLRKIGLRL